MVKKYKKLFSRIKFHLRPIGSTSIWPHYASRLLNQSFFWFFVCHKSKFLIGYVLLLWGSVRFFFSPKALCCVAYKFALARQSTLTTLTDQHMTTMDWMRTRKLWLVEKPYPVFTVSENSDRQRYLERSRNMAVSSGCCESLCYYLISVKIVFPKSYFYGIQVRK
jgi:hypothetical protein